VRPTWQGVPLAAVGHAEVQAWVTSLSASGLAPASVRQAHRVLSLVLALAVRDKRIPSNSSDGVTLPRATKTDQRFLTDAGWPRWRMPRAGTGS
jgi:hypothetical protein